MKYILGFVVFAAAFYGLNYAHYNNYGANTDALIVAQAKQGQNILAQFGEKVAEVAQVPGMARDDAIKQAQATMTGRYGPNGSKALFQFLKEQNPQIDNKLYEQIQQVIESGRNNFQASQEQLIDIERQYTAAQNYVWSGYWLKKAGYPKIDLSKYQPITTEAASDTYKTGIDKPIKLR